MCAHTSKRRSPDDVVGLPPHADALADTLAPLKRLRLDHPAPPPPVFSPQPPREEPGTPPCQTYASPIAEAYHTFVEEANDTAGLHVSFPDSVELPGGGADDGDLTTPAPSSDSSDEDSEHHRSRRRRDGPEYRLNLPEHVKRGIYAPPGALECGQPLAAALAFRVEEVPAYNPYALVPYVPLHEMLRASVAGPSFFRSFSGDMDAEELPAAAAAAEEGGPCSMAEEDASLLPDASDEAEAMED